MRRETQVILVEDVRPLGAVVAGGRFAANGAALVEPEGAAFNGKPSEGWPSVWKSRPRVGHLAVAGCSICIRAKFSTPISTSFKDKLLRSIFM